MQNLTPHRATTLTTYKNVMQIKVLLSFFYIQLHVSSVCTHQCFLTISCWLLLSPFICMVNWWFLFSNWKDLLHFVKDQAHRFLRTYYGYSSFSMQVPSTTTKWIPNIDFSDRLKQTYIKCQICMAEDWSKI